MCFKMFWVLSVTGKSPSSHHNDRQPIIVMYMLVGTDPWMPAGALALAAHADSMAIS